jgi:hypothetical protein
MIGLWGCFCLKILLQTYCSSDHIYLNNLLFLYGLPVKTEGKSHKKRQKTNIIKIIEVLSKQEFQSHILYFLMYR